MKIKLLCCILVVFSILLIASLEKKVFANSDEFKLSDNLKFRIENGLDDNVENVKQIMKSDDSNMLYGVALTNEEVEKIYSLDEKAAKISTDIVNIIGEKNFGGMYINHKSNKIHIGIVNMSKNKRLLQNIQKEYGNSNLKFHNVDYSLEYLNDVKDKINQYWIEKNLDIQYTFTDFQNSKIVVGLENTQLKKVLQDEFPKNVLKFEKSVHKGAYTEAYRAVNEYRTPFMAGQEIYTTKAKCTGGFMYKKEKSAFQITAGHCFKYGDPVFMGGTQIGKTSSVRYGMNAIADVEAISIPSEHARDYLFGTTNGEQNYFGGVEYVSGENIGQIVCVFGAVTGASEGKQCGTLQIKDYSVQYKNKETGEVEAVLTNMRAASYSSQGGDSGAPVFSAMDSEKRRIVGIHSGYSNLSNGESYRLYSHVSKVAEALNFTYSDIIFRR